MEPDFNSEAQPVKYGKGIIKMRTASEIGVKMQGMTKELDYLTLESSLKQADADYSASEAQAIACGMLSVNTSSDKITWVQLIFGEIDTTNNTQENAIRLSGELFELSKQQLQDPTLSFELLLPDDNESLYARVTAMQEWSAGYLLGVGLAGIKDHSKLPEDSRELLADFSEIGMTGQFDLEDENASEEALAEISEYIRMGVLLINEELQPIKQSTMIH